MSENATSVIDEPTVEPQGSTTETLTDSAESFLAKLVGEGKKYKTPEELAKAYANADTFIGTLKEEKRTVEQALESERNRKESELQLLAKLEAMSQTNTTGETSNGLTQNDVQRMVENLLNEQRMESKIKENKKYIWDSLTVKHGSAEAARKAVSDYISGDAGKKEALEILGRTDPDAFVRLFTPSKEPPKGAALEGHRSREIPEDFNAGALTWAKAKELKKSNPGLYHSREFQLMLHKAADNNANFYGG